MGHTKKPYSFGANNYSNQIQNQGVGGKVKGTKKCPDCEQIFASMFLRMKHVKTMHPERKIYYCPVCKAKHLYSKSLTEHILKKHPEQNQGNLLRGIGNWSGRDLVCGTSSK